MITAPLFIPSYGNRKNNLVSKLCSKEVVLKRPVKVFCYDYDFVDSGYDKYELPDNVEFVKIPFDEFKSRGFERCIQAKRQWMLEWAHKNNVDAYWQIDDDFKRAGVVVKAMSELPPEAKKCELEDKPLEDVLKDIEDRLPEDWGLAGAFNSKGSMGIVKCGNKADWITNSPVIQAVLLNAKECLKRNINYDPEKFNFEDISMMIDIVESGLTAYKAYGDYIEMEAPGKNSFTADYSKCSYNIYKKYGDFIKLRLDKSGKYKGQSSVVFAAADKHRIKNNKRKIDDDAHNRLRAAGSFEEFVNILIDLDNNGLIPPRGI